MSSAESSMLPTSVRAYLLSGTGWAFAGKAINVLAGITTNALLTRILPPATVGTYFLAFSLMLVASIVGQLGLSQAVVRLVAEPLGHGDRSRARDAAYTIFQLGTISTLFVTALLALGIGRWIAQSVFHSPELSRVVGLTIVWGAVTIWQNLVAETFRGYGNIRYAALFGGSLTNVLFMLLLVCLWITSSDADLSHVLTLAVVAGGISTLSGGVLLSREMRSPSISGQVHKIDVLETAFPFLITNLTLYVLNQTPIWIVGAFLPEEEVALYGAAVRLMTFVAIPLQVINAVVPPMIARMYGQGEKALLERALRTTATLAGIPALAALGGFTLFGQQILGIVYGEYYAGGATVLALISVGQFVNVWAGSCGQTLMMTGHQTTMMVITVLCGGLTLAFRLAAVRPYGIVGVAAVTTVGLILQNVLMLLSAKRQVGIWTYSDFSLKSIRNLFRV